MNSKLHIAGVDVDDKAYHIAIVNELGEEVFTGSCGASPSHLVRKLKKLDLADIRVCYEATYIGYSLYRALSNASIECHVIAPSLIPTLPGKKVKTDKLDSMKLAKFFLRGLLTTVAVPDEELEGDRDLMRSRNFLQGEIRAVKNHLNSYGKRFGWNYQQETGLKGYWTKTHWIWFERKVAALNIASARTAMQHLISILNALMASLGKFDQDIESLANSGKYKRQTTAIKAIRGIDTQSAMAIISEIGDIRRFDHPKRLTSYAGLDIIEHSSGGKERKFGISKMGNVHLRRTLVESCQFALQPPRISKKLAERRQGMNVDEITIADKCMHRLHKKGTRLLFNNKPRNKVKTACAREMLGFIWELLMKVA
jgi:transposase